MEKKIENIPDRNGKKRVVIVGGGFAGVEMIKRFDARKFQIVLIDKNNHHQFQPLYYQVATCGLESTSIGFSFRKSFQKKKDVHFRLCQALSIDSENKYLTTTIGTIEYDYLVIATGTYTNFFGNKALEETTMSLKTIAESIYIRNRVIRSFEMAVNTHDPEERKRLLNFVIVGGGATGVELAGALSELRKYILPKDYHDFDLSRMKIYLVDGLDRLLNMMSPRSSEKTANYLKKMGVEIVLNAQVKDYSDNKVLLANGTVIPSSNVFWVAGVIGNGLPGLDKEVYGRGNRVLVNEYNQVKGQTSIFALGDTCLMSTEKYPNGHPQVAQVAIQQGKNLVSNLERIESQKTMRPFRYKDMGTLATIGRNKAVIEMGALKFSGFFAWVIWLFVHLMAIVGVKNRLFILLDWGWSYFTHDTSLRLLIEQKR
ncbi:MAG: NAD(P)/FAD-dependent oxidoreductase [Prevotellaceae bacterium]|nr:NAD(P)/FAD-dependent oxidoreductase [Prevotellaceae bacterium]